MFYFSTEEKRTMERRDGLRPRRVLDAVLLLCARAATQVTAAHGHLAFYGAYVMLILGVITYAMPQLRRSQPFNQVLNMWGFWSLTSAMCFMTFTLTFAGAVQTHLQRVLGMNYMEVQDQLGLFYTMRLGTGIAVTVGAVLLLYALFGPARRSASGQPAMSAS